VHTIVDTPIGFTVSTIKRQQVSSPDFKKDGVRGRVGRGIVRMRGGIRREQGGGGGRRGRGRGKPGGVVGHAQGRRQPNSERVKVLRRECVVVRFVH